MKTLNHEDTKGTKRFETFDAELESLAREVVDAAFAVHKALGPGLLESAYRACLEVELRHRGIPFASELRLPIVYRGQSIDNAFRLDLLVAESLIVELKSVETLLPIHEAQLITYLKLANQRLGLLVNFNSRLIRDGIKRLAL
ncbi:MAG: GxxExxY protein [Sulfurisoma sp.]|nr:GxxExxY protein [Sulfurisoma sp.]